MFVKSPDRKTGVRRVLTLAARSDINFETWCILSLLHVLREARLVSYKLSWSFARLVPYAFQILAHVSLLGSLICTQSGNSAS